MEVVWLKLWWRWFLNFSSSLALSRGMRCGNATTCSDYIRESFITAGMFEVSAHACFRNEANLSVHLLQSKCCCLSCCSNANKLTVFTNPLLWNDTGGPWTAAFQCTLWLIILRCLKDKWKTRTWLSNIAWLAKCYITARRKNEKLCG